MAGYDAGYLEFFQHSTTVGGVKGTTGIVTGGGFTDASGIAEKRSIGLWTPAQIREGMVSASGSVNLDLQTAGIILLAKRNAVTGKLTDFDIRAGNESESEIHNACKIDTLTLDAAPESPLTAVVNWVGRYPAASGGGTHSPSTDPTLEWFEGVIAGVTVELIGASISISHNLKAIPVIDNTVDPPRSAKYIGERSQVITCNLKMLSHDTTDLSADALSYISTVTLTFVGTNTVTITLTNLKPSEKERPMTPDDIVEHGVNYLVSGFDLS